MDATVYKVMLLAIQELSVEPGINTTREYILISRINNDVGQISMAEHAEQFVVIINDGQMVDLSFFK